MTLHDHTKIAPTFLTLLPTHKCTAACQECCFGCSPRISHKMSLAKMKSVINESKKYFPSINSIVITGGECFLLGANLKRIIQYAHENNLFVCIVTNGYWAKNQNIAKEKLSKLVDAGLTEINFSTGDNHQKFVKFENIINGVLAAYEVGIRSICISVESGHDKIFKSDKIYQHTLLSPLIEEGVLSIIDAAWMTFTKQTKEKLLGYKYLENKRPCKNILKDIVIDPYGQMLSCCGLTVEFNPFLKLGNIEHNNIKEMYSKQYNDLYKIWLYVDGPEYIYERVMKERNLPILRFPHECAYCIEIINDDNNIPILQNLIKKELSNILFHFKLKNTTFKI